MPRSISGAGRNWATASPRPGRWASSASSRALADLPADAELDALIAEAAALASTAPAPRKPKHEPKPAPGLHPDFAAALDATPAAKAVLDGFSPSAQRDYLDWIQRGQAGRHAGQAHRHRGRMANRRQEAALEVSELLSGSARPDVASRARPRSPFFAPRRARARPSPRPSSAPARAATRSSRATSCPYARSRRRRSRRGVAGAGSASLVQY